MVTMPVPKGFYITSKFGQRTGQYAGMHWGTDFGNGGGSGGKPIYAVKDGTVTRSGPASGFGQWITVDHPASNGGGLTVYGHIIPEVSVGRGVKEGQRIGYINPNSATNGGVAPHLHFEWHRYAWSQPGGDRLDPMSKLAGAKWVGDTAVPSAGGTSTATIFGVDVSYFQEGMSLKKAAAEGIKFAIIRTTDGTFKDTCYQSHLEDAESAGLVTAAYHYLRNPSEGTTIAQQVAASLAVMGTKKRPIWLDCENDRGLTVAHIKEFKQRFEAAGVHVPGIYTYVPWWENKVIGGEPDIDKHGLGAVWVAAYGLNKSGTPAALYPGNAAAQWNYPLGNKKPALWQYGSNASVAGFSVDINAYRGTVEELRALFYGTTNPSTTTPKETTVTVNYGRLGFEQLAGSGEKNGEPTFTGWGIEDLITKGRDNLRKYGSATLPQMLAIAHADEFRTIINEGTAK